MFIEQKFTLGPSCLDFLLNGELVKHAMEEGDNPEKKIIKPTENLRDTLQKLKGTKEGILFDDTALSFFSGVLEYLLTELIELAGKIATQRYGEALNALPPKKIEEIKEEGFITWEDVKQSIEEDEELCLVFGGKFELKRYAKRLSIKASDKPYGAADWEIEIYLDALEGAAKKIGEKYREKYGN